MVKVSIFKNSGVVEILLYLFNYPKGKRKVDIRTDLQLNPKTATRVHDIMYKAHLLKTIKYNNAVTYALTDEGIKIAKELVKVEKIFLRLDERVEKSPNLYVFEFEDSDYEIEQDKPVDDDDVDNVIYFGKNVKITKKKKKVKWEKLG